jgi:hypothetical protein
MMICPTVAVAHLFLHGWKLLSAIRVAYCNCGCLPVLVLRIRLEVVPRASWL